MKPAISLVALMLLGAAGTAKAGTVKAGTVKAGTVKAGTVKAGGAPVIALRGQGVQIYVCAASPPGATWRLKAPEATLKASDGQVTGRHFAGPSWQAKDGSTVVGELLVSSPAPQATSIPWLLLRAKSHTGAGLFANVAYIARTETEGGTAPAAGCDTGHLGAQTKAPYSAVYTLFPAPPAP